MPKGPDLSIHAAQDLHDIAADLNDRPRKRLGYRTPCEAFATLHAEHQLGVATAP